MCWRPLMEDRKRQASRLTNAPQQQLRTATVESTSGGSASPLRKVTIYPQTFPQIENTSLSPERKDSVQQNALTQTALGKSSLYSNGLCAAHRSVCSIERKQYSTIFPLLAITRAEKGPSGAALLILSSFSSLFIHGDARFYFPRPRPRNIKRPHPGS